MKNFYITTTLPYVNADPHIGFALEIIQADILARYAKQNGADVFFNTGTDEHGIKIFQKAKEQGIDVKEYVDNYAKRFDELKGALNVSYNNFIRTTDEHHLSSAQEFWRRCLANGDIYKKNYQVKYCIGCEMEKTDSELEDDKCPLHPNQEIELISEENYFFRFSKYQQKLLDLYDADPEFVLPEGRLHEIRTFVASGLEDFSISRLKEKMPWGVPVPDDSAHVMYVWFDALVNYISALGWPENENEFAKWWPGVQIAGKDNLRQQSAMWQAMLLSAGLPTSQKILIHGFVTSDGKKMSKSIGNVVNPFDMVEKYGTDPLRYYLASEIPTFEDGDFTEAKFLESYNSALANGLGNLVSRVLKMTEQYFEGVVSKTDTEDVSLEAFIHGEILPEFHLRMEKYEIHKASETIWKVIKRLDRYVTEHEPYKLIKTDPEKTKAVLWNLLSGLDTLSQILLPFLPETAEKIQTLLCEKDGEFSVKKLESPLFPRK